MTQRHTAPALALVALLGTGCLGPNNAFNGLHSWNSRITDSKWWNELIHVGLWIVPAYELALLGDIVIFNSVEFWGADSPIGAPGPFQPQAGM